MFDPSHLPPWITHEQAGAPVHPRFDPWLDFPWGDPMHHWREHASWLGIGGWLLFLGRISGAVREYIKHRKRSKTKMI
jgi:hypothetical protein